MNNAVLYPRYSSTGQNDQTIEGQIRVCTEYAKKMGLQVIKTYDGDKAKSASKEIEKRTDFHKMIEAAKTGAFQYIIVYKMDRFARNRVESVIFKDKLEKYGVKVLSATENIADDEGGELYEMILEWRDEKFSRDLSKRVLDGLKTAIDNGTYTGQRLICGYKLVDTDRKGNKGIIHKVAIDEEQAPIIKFIFEEYAKGTNKKEIAEMLNARGLRYNGKPFHFRMFDTWLSNPRYTGEFEMCGMTVTKMFPQIIDKALFAKVQERLSQNKILAGANSAVEPYLLTGKAFCASCDTPMIAGGGTSKTGAKHYYYVCKKKNKAQCEKKRENKDTAELYAVQRVRKFLSIRENVEIAASDTINYQEKRTGDDGLRSIEARIAHANSEVEQLTDSFIMAKNDLLRLKIEKRMNEQEIYLRDLNTQKARIELERGNRLTKQDIFDFVAELLQGDEKDKEYQKKLIDNLVQKMYFYEDGTIVTYLVFNGSKSVEQITLADTNAAIQEKNTAMGVQSLSGLVHHNERNTNPVRYIFDCEYFGIIVKR